MTAARPVELGLRENASQFSLLVCVNAFVGAMVGLERSTLPLIGRDDFGLASSAAVPSFIVAFGLAKSFTNLGAGALAARLGRRRLLIAGWTVALPVPLLILGAPSWSWVVAANVMLGINPGLAWSMTVVMKIDLVGPKRRGLALGLNEAAGYGGVALAAGLSGWLASDYAARDVLVVAGAAIAVTALTVSVLLVPDTAPHVALEQSRRAGGGDSEPPALSRAFADAGYRVPALRACSQAGLVNNLNDALSWGPVPLFLAAHGASPAQVGVVAVCIPPSWASGRSGPGTAQTGSGASRSSSPGCSCMPPRSRCSPPPPAPLASPPWRRSCSARGRRSSTRRSSPPSPTRSRPSRARRWSASTASGATWATSPAR